MEDSSAMAISLTSNLDSVSAFLAESGVHYVCSLPGGALPALVRTRLAFHMAAIAGEPHGRVVAAAWLESSDASPGAAIGLLAVCEHAREFPFASRMLSLLAGEAKARGILQIATWITSDVTDPVGEFRDAGLRVVSKFNNDGSTEVVLELGEAADS